MLGDVLADAVLKFSEYLKLHQFYPPDDQLTVRIRHCVEEMEMIRRRLDGNELADFVRVGPE